MEEKWLVILDKLLIIFNELSKDPLYCFIGGIFASFIVFIPIFILLYKRSSNKLRKRHGALLEWTPTMETQAGYDVVVINDTGNDIFNVQFELSEKIKKIVDTEGEIEMLSDLKRKTLHILPKRSEFVKYFNKNKQKPIKIDVKYYLSPVRKNPIRISIFMSKEIFSKNLKDLVDRHM